MGAVLIEKIIIFRCFNEKIQVTFPFKADFARSVSHLFVRTCRFLWTFSIHHTSSNWVRNSLVRSLKSHEGNQTLEFDIKINANVVFASYLQKQNLHPQQLEKQIAYLYMVFYLFTYIYIYIYIYIYRGLPKPRFTADK